jgi:hypothetical protein
MKLDTRWLDWQPTSEKFGKSANSEPTKPTEPGFVSSVGARPRLFQKFFSLEGTPEAYEDAFSLWLQKRCLFLDRAWWGIGVLHRDYFAWCDVTGADVPSCLGTFKILLQDSGFTITDDGLVYGLALIEDFQKRAEWSPTKLTKKMGSR